MSKRDPKEVAKVMAQLRRDLLRWPDAGVVVGTIDINAFRGGVDHAVGTVDFTPVHYVALADGALERAIERMTAMLEPPLDLIASCMQARAILAFSEEKADA